MVLPWEVLAASWILAAPVHGFSSFNTTCTIPHRRYDYVQGPNTRGSLQIVWSCLATLIACTYTVLHLNVLEQRDGRDGGVASYLKARSRGPSPYSELMPLDTEAEAPRAFKLTASQLEDRSIQTELYWWFKGFAKTLVWMIITIISPEWYALIAVDNLVSAIRNKAKFTQLPSHCHPPRGWTLAHMFFANMGGFAIRSNTKRRAGDIDHLTAKSLLQLMRLQGRYIEGDSLPNQEDIQDRSKSDFFAKSLIVLQVSWFIVNCIARLASGLPTTQLEMSVFGTATCSLFTYAILFEKPYSVKSVTILLSFDMPMPGDVAEILGSDQEQRNLSGVIRNLQDPYPSFTGMATVVGFAAVIGAFHIAAWDFAFPSHADMWVWQISSVVSCAMLPVALPMLWAIESLYGSSKFAFSTMLFAALYVGTRAILAVEMIRFFFFIPPGGFGTTWADNVPHI